VTQGWSASVPLPWPVGGGVRGGGVALADLNSSGRLDLLVVYADEAGGWYRVGRDLDATGAVTGGWSDPPLPLPLPAGGPERFAGAAVADLDGDGARDLVVLQFVTSGTETAGSYLVGRDLGPDGTIAGGLAGPVQVPVPPELGPAVDGGIALADLDRDGRPEVVVLMLGNGQGDYVVGANPAGPAAWGPIIQVPDAFGRRLHGAGLAVADVNVRPVVGDRLAGTLKTLRSVWRDGVRDVPRIRASADPDGDLLHTLGMDASAREVRVRRVLGGEFLLNLQRFLGTGYFGMSAPNAWQQWLQAHRQLVDAALRAIGPPAWDTASNSRGWDPRIGGMLGDQDAWRFANTLVTLHTGVDLPASEHDPLAPENYIDWLLTHGGDLAQLRSGLKGITGERPPLLALMLLHALLREHARVGLDVLTGSVPPLADDADRREHELVGMPVVDPTGRTAVHNTVWDWFATPLPQLGVTLAERLAQLWGAPAGPYAELASALAHLRDLPTAELERLFGETLDVCSHRLDAWITAMAANRLAEMRRSFPTGVHLAAYGWVEDLEPGGTGRFGTATVDGKTVLTQKGGGGHVHAPSLTHAAAAAILRNAHVTRSGTDRRRYAVDLSSARARDARALFDVLRDGQTMGDVLGYRLERGLHERSQAGPPAASLERFIGPLRESFPPVAGKGPQTAAPAAPAGAVAARNVVDGLALRSRWHAGGIDMSKLAPGEPPAVVAALQAALASEVEAMDELLDAAADLLTAEGVYQLVRGNPAGAAASLDALAQGLRPPDPEIAAAPRGGIALTHRVAVVLGDPPAAVPAPWPTTPTERALASPAVDGWAAALLGDPSTVRCRVRIVEADGTESAKEITLAQLDLRPIDVLALAPAGPSAAAGELDRRIAWAASAPADAEVRIVYAAAPAWDRATTRTFPEVLEVARALMAVIGSARPLTPADLVPPEAAGSLPDGWMGDATLQHAQTARTHLDTLAGSLGASVTALGAAAPPAGAFTTAREVLRHASQFGLAGAFPATRNGTDEAVRTALLAQTQSVHDEALRRSGEAGAVQPPASAGAAEKVEAAVTIAGLVLGRDVPFLGSFVPPGASELGLALAGGPASVAATPVARARVLRRWAQQLGRIRPPMARWRRLGLYAEAAGAPLGIEVAQLPFQAGEPWIGLPIAGARPPSGRVSLVLRRVAAPAATAAWAGLLIDEWTEVIPNERELTGIAFHYDNPGAEAPQAVLLAVPPTAAARWDEATALDILHETLDLAQLRTVDGQAVGGLGQLLPTILLAANQQRDTVSTDFTMLRTGNG
jgi:hypothetical protein